MGQEMAVESRCSGPGSRVELIPTVDILAVELSMTCITKASSGTQSGPMATPVGGASFNARRIFGRAAMGRIGSPEKI